MGTPRRIFDICDQLVGREDVGRRGGAVRSDHDGLAVAGCPSLVPSTRLRVSGPSRKWIHASAICDRLGGRNDG